MASRGTTPAPDRKRSRGGLIAGLLAGVAALIAIPVGLAVVVGLVAVLLLSSLTIGPCGFDLSGPDRTDCLSSKSALVRASLTQGRAGVDRELGRAKGPAPDDPDVEGNRPLACAALAGNREAVRALLQAGARPSLPGHAGGRPIVAAVSGEGRSGNEPASAFTELGSTERVDIVKLLVTAGADPSPALAPAVEKRLLPMIDTLLRLGADPNGPADQPSPLLTATWKADRELVLLLLSRGAEANRGGQANGRDAGLALMAAAAVTTVPTSAGGTPTASAPSTDRGPGFDATSYASQLPPVGEVPPIVAAAMDRKIDGGQGILTDLLKAGADPDRLAFNRFSSLWVAAAVGNHAAALLLVQAGAVADGPGREPATAVARARNDQAMLAILGG